MSLRIRREKEGRVKCHRGGKERGKGKGEGRKGKRGNGGKVKGKKERRGEKGKMKERRKGKKEWKGEGEG